MKTLALFASLILLGQQQTPSEIAAGLRHYADQVEGLTLSATPPEKLADALNAGGVIHLQPGATYTQNIVMRVSGTKLYYDGAISHPIFGPAVEIPPGINDVEVHDFNGTTDGKDRVILCGHNDSTQTTLDSVPKNIKIINATIPDYPGKRGIEVNCTGEINGATISMTGKLGQDTQGIGIANTPGPVWIHGVKITGGVESIMSGGDTMKIPVIGPADITIEDFSLYHPLDWRGQGYGIKDLLEYKNCTRCIARRGVLDGSFKDAQVGYGIVVTPRNGGVTRDLLFEDLKIRNVASAFNILGKTNNAPATPNATDKVVIRRVEAAVNEELGRTPGSTQGSSMGLFAFLSGGVVDLTVDTSTFTCNLCGSRFIATEAGSVIQSDGTMVPGAPMDLMSVTGSTFQANKYGFMLNGVPNAGPTQKGVKTLTVTGNTIFGAASALKTNLPNNTYK